MRFCKDKKTTHWWDLELRNGKEQRIPLSGQQWLEEFQPFGNHLPITAANTWPRRHHPRHLAVVNSAPPVTPRPLRLIMLEADWPITGRRARMDSNDLAGASVCACVRACVTFREAVSVSWTCDEHTNHHRVDTIFFLTLDLGGCEEKTNIHVCIYTVYYTLHYIHIYTIFPYSFCMKVKSTGDHCELCVAVLWPSPGPAAPPSGCGSGHCGRTWWSPPPSSCRWASPTRTAESPGACRGTDVMPIALK